MRQANRPLLVLLGLVLLINLPFLSPRLIFVHDTLVKFDFYHFVYSQLYFHDELPRWVPYVYYGLPADFLLFAIQPTDWILLPIGWLLGVEDALLLFKLGMILNQGLFALGMYLLCRRFYNSTLAVMLVCCGAILTNSWLFNYGFNFLTFYLIPLVLYYWMRFLEEGRPTDLWLAALVELASLVGNIPYILTVHLLILVTFAVPFLLEKPGRLLHFARWRNFVHPLFFLSLGFLALLGTYLLGMFRETTILTTGRDQDTGEMGLDVFLSHSYQPIATIFWLFVRGDVPHGDMTCYIGVLPLATALYALARRRDACFWSVALVTLVLFWLALGGWFSSLAFHGFPLMYRYRHISYVCNIAKVFLLLMGGFGIDQLLRDLAGQRSTSSLPRWTGWLLLAIVSAFALDLIARVKPGDLDELRWVTFDYTFSDSWLAPYLLAGRYALYAILFAGLLRMLSGAAGPSAATRVGRRFALVYLIDVASFYGLMLMTAPFISVDVERIGTTNVHPLVLTLRSIDAHEFPLVQANMQVLDAPRSGAVFLAWYADLYLVLGADPLIPRFPFVLISTGVKDMIVARGGTVTPVGLDLPKDHAFLEMLGASSKWRVVGRARFNPYYEGCVRMLRASDDPADTLILAAHGSAAIGTKGDIGVASTRTFSANEVSVRVEASESGWLYYADAFHPGWKATVNGRDTPIVRANVGFKAVPVDAGESEVVFRFDDGVRDWVRRGLFLAALVAGLWLVSLMLAVPWLPADTVPALERLDVDSLGVLRTWLGWMVVGSLAGACWMLPAVGVLALPVLFLATYAVFLRVHALEPAAPARGWRVPLACAAGSVVLVLAIAWIWKFGWDRHPNMLVATVLAAFLLARVGRLRAAPRQTGP